MLLQRQELATPSSSDSQVTQALSSVNAGLVTEMLLFGVHLVLFPICVYIILRQRPTRQYVILVAVTSMFALSTADVAITLRSAMRDLPALLLGRITADTFGRRQHPKFLIFVTNNLIADLLLIYRCYMVWGKRLPIIVVSSVLLMLDTVWGWIGAFPKTKLPTFASMYLGSVFAMNIIMTGLTAGRIWWISRTTKGFLPKGHLRSYNVAIAILVQSGLLYSVVLLIALLSLTSTHPFNAIMVSMMFRTVAIVPTLMVVQAGLGRNIHPNQVENNLPSQPCDESTVPDISRATAEQVGADSHGRSGDQATTVQSQPECQSRHQATAMTRTDASDGSKEG